MKKTCLNALLSLVFLLVFFLTASKILAADTVTLIASPVRLGDDASLTLQPGEKKQVQVKVHNASDSELSVESKVVDFTIAENGETPLPLENLDEASSNRWSLASWLTLAPSVHRLTPGETATVNVLIEVPEDALPGGHYAMVYHQPENAALADMSASGVTQRVSTLLYVVVAGDITQAAAISEFNWPKFLENGPVDFSLVVDNQSDVHVAALPEVKVYNLFGQEVADLKLEQKNIFPLSQRSFDGRWDKMWGFGPYKAVAEVIYGGEGQVATATAMMWMIPVKLLLLALIIILVLLILIISIKKHKQNGGPPQNEQPDSWNQALDAREDNPQTSADQS